MAALEISDNQETIINNSDENFEGSFYYGVINTALAELLPEIPEFSTLSEDQQQIIKDIYKSALAVVVKTLNIDNAFPNVKFSGSAVLKALTLSAGTISFTDGICTTRTNPT